MKSIDKLRILVAAAVFGICAFPARADADDPSTVTFDSVDSYRMSQPSGTAHLTITGVLHGASMATTLDYYASSSSQLMSFCERQVIIAFNRPGRFSLTVNVFPGSTSIQYCALTRLP